MNRVHRSLSIAFVLSGFAGASLADQVPAPAATTPASQAVAPLLAALAPHKDAWRPCHDTGIRLLDNAAARSTATAENRTADFARLDAEAEQIGIDFVRRDCSKLKQRMMKDLRAAGAKDADMQPTWNAFLKSLAPVEEKK